MRRSCWVKVGCSMLLLIVGLLAAPRRAAAEAACLMGAVRAIATFEGSTPSVRGLRAMYELGRIYLRTGAHADAALVFERAGASPDGSVARDALSSALLIRIGLGDHESASDDAARLAKLGTTTKNRTEALSRTGRR